MDDKILKLETLQDSDNIEPLLGEEQSKTIGFNVCQDFETDKQSRSKWETSMNEANELALQITKEKQYPWANAANVKFPLLTIASLQFASRAYPALVKAPNLVKYRVRGEDDGKKSSRAIRVGAHMSYQLLDEDEQWEEDQDKAFLALPILGCVFKKSYYDSVKEHNCSTLVLPKNLVVHYYAKNLEDCERKTEIFQMYERNIKERQLRGVFSTKELGLAQMEDNRDEDKRQGLSPPVNESSRPRTLLEQHCYLDLDGDGYKEPYVVTVDKSSKKVLRIVSRFKKVITEQAVEIEALQTRMKALAEGVQRPEQLTPEAMAQIKRVEATITEMDARVKELAAEKPKILRIIPVEHYTKYPFIPSPDGGFYDLGFGLLLGPLNDSVNTLINQLIDSGSLQNGSVGFIGKGARIKGGKVRFSPNEWKRVDVSGATLKDALVPLPINQPSAVLFNLLSLLITYTERVASVNDAMMGENPGQNTPAFTSNQMLEQGLQVFNGIFKRVYRAFRSEIRKLYDLNSIYLPEQKYFEFHDKDLNVIRADYGGDSKDLVPAADPNAFSNTEKLQKAQMVSQRAEMAPGYDRMQAERRLLMSMDIPDVDEVFPLVPEVNPETGEQTGNLTYKFPPQPNPELEIEKADMQRRTLEGQSRAEKDMLLAQSKVKVDQASIIKMMMEAEVAEDNAEFRKLELLLKEQEMIAKNLVEIAKIDNAKATSGVDGKSGNA